MKELKDLKEQFQAQLEAIKGIQVEAYPLLDTVIDGVNQENPVLFNIKAGPMSKDTVAERKRLNLAVVLDRSGSMDGAPLENCKTAVCQVIQQLGPHDKLHFVTYDTLIETVLCNVNCDSARDSIPKVESICTGGCTNLFGGVEQGVQLLKKHHEDGVIDALFLFSDGFANEGVQNEEEIGSRIKDFHLNTGIRFSTFGIGSGFNEKLMSSIARCGKGNYFYIDNMERVPELVTKAFNGLLNIVAENATLKVRGRNGANVTFETSEKKFDNIREYGFHQFLTKTNQQNFTQKCDPTPGLYWKYLDWQLTYFDPVTKEDKILTGDVKLKVNCGFDNVQMESHPDVIVHLVMLKCSELNEQALNAVKEGNLCKTKEIKKQIIKEYERVQELDQYGFIHALLTKERDALNNIEREGLTQRTTKMAAAAGAAAPGAKYDRMNYENDEEEEGDMGFGLFD